MIAELESRYEEGLCIHFTKKRTWLNWDREKENNKEKAAERHFGLYK
jgi:hypothetical protein